MSAVVEVQHLRKAYGGVLAVDDVSLEVEEGEIFGLLGPNGAGKTTTVECPEGLRRPGEGRIRVLGLDPSREPRELRRRIGCQLQQAALPDRIRVWEALDLFATLAPQGVPWRAVLDIWGLEGKRKAAFSSLSGGEQQRLFVALALINQAQVVFLDELTQGLDPAARRVAGPGHRLLRGGDRGRRRAAGSGPSCLSLRRSPVIARGGPGLRGRPDQLPRPRSAHHRPLPHHPRRAERRSGPLLDRKSVV